MATSLLLEGEDLEALLLRAAQEGGPGARIVRAEKVRHGGVMGFFARERFEVAVEIPDDESGRPATPLSRRALRSAVNALSGGDSFADLREPHGDGDQDGYQDDPADAAPEQVYEQSHAAALADLLAQSVSDEVEVAEVTAGAVPAAIVPALVPAVVPAVTVQTASPAVARAYLANEPSSVLATPASAVPAAHPVVPAAPVIIPASPAAAAPPVTAAALPSEGDTVPTTPGRHAADGTVDEEPATKPADDELVRLISGELSPGELAAEGLLGVVDRVSAAELAAARSVAGQPLADPAGLAFHVPLQRQSSPGEPARPAIQLPRESEVGYAAQSAAYAAMYAAAHTRDDQHRSPVSSAAVATSAQPTGPGESAGEVDRPTGGQVGLRERTERAVQLDVDLGGLHPVVPADARWQAATFPVATPGMLSPLPGSAPSHSGMVLGAALAAPPAGSATDEGGDDDVSAASTPSAPARSSRSKPLVPAQVRASEVTDGETTHTTPERALVSVGAAVGEGPQEPRLVPSTMSGPWQNVPTPAHMVTGYLGAGSQNGTVPHETPSTTARPSTARPEFTALLDQLRSGTRPRSGNSALQATPQPSADEPLTSEPALYAEPAMDDAHLTYTRPGTNPELSAEDLGALEQHRHAAEAAAGQAARLVTERLEAERLEAERIAAWRADEERRQAERQAQEQWEAQNAQAALLEAERMAYLNAQTQTIEAEAAAAVRAETERMEAERLQAEREHAERLQAEAAAVVRAEAERIAAEQIEAHRREAERLAAELAEAERIAAERAEAERIAAERAEAERLESQRLAAELAEAERIAAELAEAERQAAERAERAEAERIEAERLVAEREEQDRIEAERVEAARIAVLRAEADLVEAEWADAGPTGQEQTHQTHSVPTQHQPARMDAHADLARLEPARTDPWTGRGLPRRAPVGGVSRADHETPLGDGFDDAYDALPARAVEQQVAADRAMLRDLGIPASWTRRLRQGDRFSGVLKMLEQMPAVDIDPDVAVVAVVGPAHLVHLEAFRTAADLPVNGRPRPVVVIPATVGPARAAELARSQRHAAVVVAIETPGYEGVEMVLESLETVRAGALVAIVDAARPLRETQAWLDALGSVDALAVDGATTVPRPAAVLQLGLPVVRLDGIPIDHVTWTALLCAQLEAAKPADQRG